MHPVYSAPVEPALLAVFRAVRRKLTATPELWDKRVHTNRPPGKPETWVRPYVVLSDSGGQELNTVRSTDAEVLLDVWSIADSEEQALQMFGRVNALLNDQGSQDINPAGATTYLDTTLSAGVSMGTAVWRILTCTLEQYLHDIQDIEGGAKQIYLRGGRYRIRLEQVS